MSTVEPGKPFAREKVVAHQWVRRTQADFENARITSVRTPPHDQRGEEMFFEPTGMFQTGDMQPHLLGHLWRLNKDNPTDKHPRIQVQRFYTISGKRFASDWWSCDSREIGRRRDGIFS